MLRIDGPSASRISTDAEISRAEAEAQAARVEIDRLLIRAPADGNILQINIRPGEFGQGGVLPQPLMLLGDLNRLHVRVDIDENDAWRFHPSGKAVAFIRGNPKLKTELTFEYIEPYVVPKRSLTGDSTERVDTRVMQVIYSFPRTALNVYPGISRTKPVSLNRCPIRFSRGERNEPNPCNPPCDFPSSCRM